MNYLKYTTQKLQISHDDGETWEDVSPSVTRLGDYLGTYNTVEDCQSGSPQNVYSIVDITTEMENCLYGYILEDGTVRLRKLENAIKDKEYSISASTNEINIIDLEINWWPEYVGRVWTRDECLKKVRTIIIGNEAVECTGIYIGDNLINKFIYCNYLYLCDSIKAFSGGNNNIEKVKMSKNIDSFTCSMPYIKELTFYSDVNLVFKNYVHSCIKKITVYGALKEYSQVNQFFEDARICPNLETILVYGGREIGKIDLDEHTRIYIPDALISLYGNNKIIPLSQYKYDISNLQTSQKAKALNVFGKTIEIPNNGSNILTENETKRYFSASSETDSVIYEGRNELSFISIGTSVEEIDSYAFSMNRGLVPYRGYTTVVTLAIPNTVSSMGESVFSGSSIQNLIFRGSTPPSFNSTFRDFGYICNIYVPDGSFTKYFEAFMEYPNLVKKLKFLSEYEIA